MALYITIHKEGSLLELTPNDTAIELQLDEKTMQTLAMLEGLESYRIACALGELFMAGVQEGHKASRRRKVSQPNS